MISTGSKCQIFTTSAWPSSSENRLEDKVARCEIVANTQYNEAGFRPCNRTRVGEDVGVAILFRKLSHANYP